MAITYNDLYLDVRGKLRESGAESATLESREIVAFAAGKTKEQLFRDLRLYASDETVAKAADLLCRRLRGEPVAYLIGEWEFYGLPMAVNEHILIPRADTEVLVDKVIADLKGKSGNKRVLDLCCGSGCIGIAIAANVPECTVVLGDISEHALRISRQNARQNNVSASTTVLRIDALSEMTKGFGEFDCIVCNPPYIPTADIEELDTSVKDFEPHSALDGGADGLDFYRAVVKNWSTTLPAGGKLFFEVGIGQCDDVLRIMRACGFGDIEFIEDTGGISRVVYGTLYTEI